ncbi:MAG: 4Fe-4S binding protein [Deltaproteobacteria bacterium]|nr:4Fe-4S binding protein [Deltaproteobacteria bacterium]
MRGSTRRLMAKHGWRIDKAIHNYIYFAFYYPYVWTLTQYAGKLFPKTTWFKPINPILRMITSRYHAKMLSGGDVQQILTLNEDVVATSDKNKRIIPFTYAHKILFQNPDYIAVMDCPCKRSLGVKDPKLLNSCICVGKNTAEFWVDRCGKKYHARRINQKEALDIVTKFRKMGYITQIFFKVATGGAAGVICSCHKSSCPELRAHLAMRKCAPDLRMTADSGYSIRHDESICKHCGTCAKICQFEAITFKNNRVEYERRNCLGCGLCTEHCPQGALKLYQDPGKAVPLNIDIVKREYLSH